MVVAKNLQSESEIWNRNTDVLNMISYGQLLFMAGIQKKNPKEMYDGCIYMFTVIGPMFKHEQEIEYQRKGVTEVQKRIVRGVNTDLFQIYIKNLEAANRHIVASSNIEYDARSRFMAAQTAYAILFATGMNLLQEVNSMGFNIKLKNAGYNAALSGS